MRRRVFSRSLVGAAVASLFVTASAHAYLSTSTPADGAALSSAPTQIVLHYTEAVQKNFSLFAVLPVMVPAKRGESARQHSQRVHALAAQVADNVMAEKKGSLKGRVDTGLEQPDARSKSVTVNLEKNLPAGTYVVVWRAMSVDTHVTHGIVVFTVGSGG